MSKGRLKLILALSVVILCLCGIPLTFVLLEEILYEKVIILDKEQEDSKGKPIYKIKDITKEQVSSKCSELETQKMIDAGFTAEETKVLQAFESLWGGFNEKEISKYFGFKSDLVRKTVTPLIIPAMCEEMKWGIKGELSIAQSIHELGWNYKEANIKEPTSPAWKYYNAHGIKVGSTQPNEYWTGSSETVSTKEYWTPGVASTIQDEFKSFNGFWESFQEHGRMLTEVERYAVGNFNKADNVNEYAIKLRECGYYTDSSENYSATMESIYTRACLNKYRNLYNEVLNVLNKDKVSEGEWKPNGSESYGYFINPCDGLLLEDYGLKNDNTFNIGWKYKLKRSSKVLAVKSGTVVCEEPLTIEHDSKEIILYKNFKSNIKTNDKVNQGQTLGVAKEVLEIQIIKNRKYVDPKIYYDGKCGEEYKPKSAPDFGSYMNKTGYSLIDSSKYLNSRSEWINEFQVNLVGLSNKRLEFLQEATQHLGKPYL